MLNKTTNRYAFELTDHLGNVRAVVAKNASTSAVDVLSYTDYYPHGGVMPGRNFVSSPSYKLGYQGQEKDAETNFSNFELRQMDARLGRWFNPDPMHQYFSPYLAMGNNPVSMTDPTGGVVEQEEGGIDDYMFDRMMNGDWMEVGSLYDWSRMNPHDRAAMQEYYGTGNTYTMFVVGNGMHMTGDGAAEAFNEMFKSVGLEANYKPSDKLFQYTEVRYSDMVLGGFFSVEHSGDISFKEAQGLSFSIIGEDKGWQLSPTGRMYVADYYFTGKEKAAAESRNEFRHKYSWYSRSSGRIDQSFLIEEQVIGGILIKGAVTGVKGLISGTEVTVLNSVNTATRTESAAYKSLDATDGQHYFPDIVDNYASYATQFPLKGGDGVMRNLFQVGGSLRGDSGIFEWIVEGTNVTHRRFIKNGIINGLPNQIVKP